ncbi:MAG: MFS transporter [Candidatus Bathyarchaeota archaeon]|nr:MFS transporter [Candidatus Bathyarchaeota archaeon]MDH5790674.1 MFS transporter [Candidatus Bathyarchaeota archaeon]
MAITLAQSISMFASFLWRPFWGLYILELGGSKAVLGALSTLQAFSNLLLQLPGGVLADRLGRRRVILAGALFGFLPPLIFRLSTHWTMLIPGIIASSLTALAVPARDALIAESLPPESRATGFGAYTMSWYLFIVLAYPFGGYMMDTMGVVPGVRLGLALTFLVMVPIAVIQWRFVTETLGTGPGAREEAAVPKPRASLSLLRMAPREVWKLMAVAVLSSFGFQIFWSFVVIYCVEVLGMSKMQWSIVSIVANLVAACFMVPSGFLSDRARRRPYVILSQTLVSLASLGYVLSSGFWGVLLTRVVGGVGEGLGGNVMSSVGGPVWQALVTEVAPTELRGSILGLMGTLTGFLCTPAPMVGGFLYESVSPQSPFYVSLVLGLLGCLTFALFVREPRRARRSENTL